MEEMRLPWTKKKSRAEEIDDLMRMLQPGTGLGVAIERHLQDLPSKYVILLITGFKEYAHLPLQLIQYFARKKMDGIYVTTNKSAVDLIDALNKNGLDDARIFIIDTITRKSGYVETEKRNVRYIDSPEELTELSTQIEECIEAMPSGPHFFVFDSISTMLVYNAERTVEKFTHGLSGKLRSKQFQAIFTMAGETRGEIVNILAQFCDKILELNEPTASAKG
ncbi:MAG: hypothetical protein NTW59_00745 [Candidatus Diapherotrites archaeon]|nr:hypothetical protein [Candidatus Diapherotrites archaeon]